ncbi:MAG TPA: hypothetical protein VM097_02395 [Mycobacteriales bacterium]|nr:hypothetical protein [Mycobacteriales bacterium]
MRRALMIVVSAALLLGALPSGAAAPTTVDGVPCAPGALPETGLQGEVPLADQLSGRSKDGYSCNVRIVGSNDLAGRGGDTQMTWYGRCAYRSAGGGNSVAVLDVRDPRSPKVARWLQEPAWAGKGGTLGIHEGLTVSEQRGILAVPLGTALWVYDVRRCLTPRLLGTFDFGLPPGDVLKNLPRGDDGIHSGKLSPDGTLYYATDLGFGPGSATGPCLTVVDLRDLRRMRLVTRWQPDTPCHDLSLSPDGRTAYVGYYAATYGHPSAVVGAFTPTAAASPHSGLRVVDVSQVQAHRPRPQLTVLSEVTGGRQHTETVTRIGRRTYVIAAEEAVCPGGAARIVDVTNPRKPVQVAEMPLQVNELENCWTFREDTTGGVLLYTSHYVSVDDPTNASLAFVTWYSSGLRVFDVRDPAHPKEVAYLNPAVGSEAGVSHDSATTYTRWLPEKGQMWFGSGVRGFTVAELSPTVRPRRGGRWSVPAGHQVAPPRALDLQSYLAMKGIRWACSL